jgi:hypothetical protein
MNILKVIPKVHAQADAVAQPTFGSIDIGGGETIAAQVLLNTSFSSVEVGKQFTVQVEVRTNEITLNGYNIVVEYDPSILTVVDQNPDISGTQVKLLDPVFNTTSEPEDNFVDIVKGEIFLSASITEGSGLTVNRSVFEVAFQAQSIGAATIKIKEGANGTKLIRPSGQTIRYTSNQRSIDIVEDSEQAGEPVNQQSGSNVQDAGQQNEGNVVVGEIPDTAISDEINNVATLGSGFMLILLGLLLLFNRRRKDDDE